MKWFRHETDAHQNLKLQSVIEKFGLVGIGYYWCCVELVGKEGEKFKIPQKKDWKTYFKKFLNIEISKQDEFLEYFAKIDLIDKKSLNKGDLHIPKLEDRQDDYTKKVRRISGQDTDNIPLQDNTKQDNTKQDKKVYGEFSKVRLSDTEYQKLIEKLGDSTAKEMIERLDSYVASKGKKYSSHYATILNWSKSTKSIQPRVALEDLTKIK